MPCSICKENGHNSITCPGKKTDVVLESLLDISPIVKFDIDFITKLSTEILDTLGAGHTESVYHNAIKVGLQDTALKFETERDIIIKFRNRYVGTVRADIIIENRLVIELKASTGTDSVVSDAMEQCRIYMKETEIPYGVVVIFPKRVSGKLIIQQVSN